MKVAEQLSKQYTEKGGAARRRFLAIAKNSWGCLSLPPPPQLGAG